MLTFKKALIDVASPEAARSVGMLQYSLLQTCTASWTAESEATMATGRSWKGTGLVYDNWSQAH